MANDAPIARAKPRPASAPNHKPLDGAGIVLRQLSRQMAKRAPVAPAGDRPHQPGTRASEQPMPRLQFPNRLERQKTREPNGRECPAHRAWVRRHHCCVPGCLGRPIECAHVRGGTDGGIALKPSDRWSVSLCRNHHIEQHQVGELSFGQKYGIDLRELAKLFARRSPHHRKLRSAEPNQ